ERAIDLGQDQRLSAKKALDLGGVCPNTLSLPHARFSGLIDLVDQVRESLDVVSSEIRLDREASRRFLCLLHHYLEYFSYLLSSLGARMFGRLFIIVARFKGPAALCEELQEFGVRL